MYAKNASVHFAEGGIYCMTVREVRQYFSKLNIFNSLLF